MTSLTTERLGQLTISCSVRFFHRALPPPRSTAIRAVQTRGQTRKAFKRKPPQAENILTAITGNQRIAVSASDPAKRAIALTWLFHLVGDLHQSCVNLVNDGGPVRAVTSERFSRCSYTWPFAQVLHIFHSWFHIPQRSFQRLRL